MQYSKSPYYFCFILLVIYSFSSCGKKTVPTKIEETQEEREYLPAPGDEENTQPRQKTDPSTLPKMTAINTISEIQLPLVIDSAALIKQINALIPQVLYEDRDLSDDKMIVVAEKMDSVNLSIQANKIVYDVPFKLHIERDIGISVIKADGSLKLSFNTDYKVLENWAFETKTTITKHEWIETPKVKLGFLNIPVESIADKIVLKSSDMVCQNIDAQLMEGFKLRDHIDLAWRKVQQPIQITDTPVVSWLLIQPQKIMMEPIVTFNGNVQTSIIFRSITDMVFGPKPDIPYAGILPAFEQLSKTNKDSLISISIRFPLKRAEILLSDFFRGQRFVDGNKVMIIDSIHLFGDKNKLQAEAFVSGSYPAILQFEGVPVYNKRIRRFELNEMKYSLKSKNVLVKAASWILKKNIDKKLSELLIYDVGKYFDEGKINLEKTISNVSSYGFKMQADIKDIWAEDPIIIGQDAEIKIWSNGKFRIIIDELVN